MAEPEVALEDVRRVVAESGQQLRGEGVVDVRAGYRFKHGWITDEPAVVVSVLPGHSDGVPETFHGVPVEVRAATVAEQWKAARGAADGQVHALGVEAQGLAAEGVQALAMPREDYEPAPGLSLAPVSGAMTVTCCASPDAGWPVLKDFLTGAEDHLTIAMYELAAPHIRDALKAVPGSIGLILDPGADRQAHGDVPEAAIVTDLQTALADRLTFLWAAVPTKHRVTAAIFPNAYHIKVAVRDGAAIWLSSGNWKSTNQPTAAPALDSDAPPFRGSVDRDWHVVVEHPGLASVFEAAIRHDMQQAGPLQAAPGIQSLAVSAAVLPDVFVPPDFLEGMALEPASFVPPQTFSFHEDAPLRVTPLLTPDNYSDGILDLIQSARKSVWFQNQYIKPNDAEPEFMRLVEALARKMKDGLDVRIILRRMPVSPEDDIRSGLEALQQAGIAPGAVRLMPGCHNKGIIVDGEKVAIGSHNWSANGALRNRDATLIFESEAIANYYGRLFEHDWERYRAHPPKETPVIAQGAAAPPPGWKRVTWTEAFGT